MIRGVDFSHWQSKVSTDKLKTAGIQFAIVKAGEVYIKTVNKPAVTDDMHDRNIRELKRVGIICGDYYYFHPSAGASKQARHYAAIRKTNQPDLPPVIDIEDSDGYKPLDVAKQILAFIAELQAKTGQQPIIYSRNGFLVNDCGNPDWPANTLFWIARYGMTIKDLSPKIKPNVVIWQYTDQLALPGLPKMDGNYWLRSKEDLDSLAGLSAPAPAPRPISNEPIEETGFKRNLWDYCRSTLQGQSAEIPEVGRLQGGTTEGKKLDDNPVEPVQPKRTLWDYLKTSLRIK